MLELAIVLVGGVIGASIWWLVLFEEHSYRVDLTRQRLFLERDKLFDMAANGEIAFDSAAYGMARAQFNGMIRFTHQLSFGRLALLGVLVLLSPAFRHQIERFSKKRDYVIRSAPAEAQEKIHDAIRKMHLLVLSHLYYTSPLLRTLAIPLVAALFFTKSLIWAKSAIVDKCAGPWRAVDYEAYTEFDDHIGGAATV